MLIVEDILKSMKKHFPRWMDIRRKYSSSGSLLLESVAEEVADIQTAIEEYKKDFFIDKYINNEDEILTFLYKANIGGVDKESLIMINPDIEIVTEQNDFFVNDNTCYYADGIIYFKEDYKEIQYAIDGYKSKIVLEKIHVWNIFDEFATFVGLRRYQWETNKELVNRILNKANKKINSSEDGLKEALITNLINIAPNLSKEDISIERPTPENLIKYYDEFETILDHLNQVNRDVYKDKKWDIDTWNFAIKSIDYIPHAWDIALKSYTNGIGDNDDLKVSIIDDNAKTDALISFYKKDPAAINAYIKNHNIKEDFELHLKKYDNDLKPENVKYNITASEAIQLNPLSTSFDFYEEKIKESELLLQDIADDFLIGVKVQDNALLDSKFKYKLRFIPTNELGDFKITELKQSDALGIKNPINLIQEKSGFKFIDESKEGVRSGKVIKHITDKYQYSSITNAIKTTDGFKIDNISENADFKININGCANEMLSYEYTCKEVPLLFSYVNRVNCYISQDTIISDTVEEDKYIEISAEMNSISMIIEGPYSIEYSINENGYITSDNHSNVKSEFKLDGYHTPQKMKIKITLQKPGCKISNLMYSKYDFKMKTELGDLTHNPKGSYLPSADINNLYISMKGYTGQSPILKHIHIGSIMNDNDYYGDIEFDPSKGGKLIAKYNDCRLQLSKIDKANGNVIEVIEDYIPYKFYSAANNNAQIELLLNEYYNIESIEAPGCDIETMSYGDSYVQCLLKIPADISIHSIKIKGSSKRIIKSVTLDSILNVKGYSITENEFFTSKNSEYIIVKNKINKSLRYVHLERRDLFGDLNITLVKVNYINSNNIIAKFIERSADSLDTRTTTISNNFNGYFDFLTFVPTSGDIYKAINAYDVIFPETNDISIVNTFTKGYDPSKRMFYSISSFNDNYNVLFSNNLSTNHLDESKISIVRKTMDNIDYNYEVLVVKQELALNTRVELPSTFILPNKEQIDLSKYVIINYDNIIYKTRHDDPDASLDYMKTESIYVDNTGFNKLKFSNIHDIISISKNGGNLTESLEEGVHFKVLYKEGIIVWIDKNLIKEEPIITVKYYIKKATYIEFDINDLYEKVKYNVNSLNLINKIQLEKLAVDDTIDLNLYDSYKEADLTSIYCSQPGFVASVENDILKFSKNLENNTVAIRTGFYYMDGNEYYMFADENFDNIEKIDDIILNNVIKLNKKFILRQQTTNFVTNSSMLLNVVGDMFNLDCTDEKILGASKLNIISACESFNYWKTVGSNLSIVKGLNGQGINLTAMTNINGYAYIPISKFLTEEDTYMISFYMKGDKAKAYLGKERIVYSTNSIFNKESVIDINKQITESEIEDNIYEIAFEHKEEDNYYLIISNTGLIDDIIITNKDKFELGMHKKNIDHLNLSIEENIYAEYNTRLYLTEEDGATFDGTELDIEQNIVNTSYVHWGFTDIKNIDNYTDFKKCVLTNVDLDQYNNKCVAKTLSNKGSILTNPIYIGNTKVIKNLVFKINNVMFDNMKGFKVKVLTASSANESFKEVSQHLDNIGCVSGDNLLSYVKLMVEMPANKVINNIELFIEYLSNEVDTPADMSVLSGTYTSKVLDAQYSERFRIKNINFSDNNKNIGNYIFEVRASKENDEKTVWTNWKEIKLKNNIDDIENGNILNRIVYEDYRYFQFKLTLKGEDASIKANYIDLEVI